MPHAADDLYRAVKRLPGAAGGDFTAKINVRGGEQDELLVILDGLELYEPFHLKDFQSVFSIIDSEAIGGVDFLTGGFPVQYGDRMSGVMDITVATPTGPATTAIDISTINARLVTQGSFNEDRGRYFVSARAWYPAAIVQSDQRSVLRCDHRLLRCSGQDPAPDGPAIRALGQPAGGLRRPRLQPGRGR